VTRSAEVLVGTGAAHRWTRIVEELEASGLSAREFAKRREINASTLKWWRSHLRPSGLEDPASGALSFVEVQIGAPVAAVRVHLDRASVSLEVQAGTDLQWLRAVVDALC